VLNKDHLETDLIKRAEKKGAVFSFNEKKDAFEKGFGFNVGAWGVSPITPYDKRFNEFQIGYQFTMEGVDVENAKTLVLKNDARYY